jgi:hypothetical protein
MVLPWTCLSAAIAVSAKPPALDCGPAEVELGTVAQGRTVRVDRACRNTGMTELVLPDPATACRCLSASFDRQRVPPGGTARLRMGFQTDGISDRVEFAVDLDVRSGRDSARQTLMVSADVRPSVIAVPEYVDLGDYRRNPVRQVLIVDTTGRDFSIRQVVSERSEVEVRWSQVELVRMGDRWEPSASRGAVTGYQVTLSARPSGGRKSLSDEVEIDIAHELQKSLRLRVVGYSP